MSQYKKEGQAPSLTFSLTFLSNPQTRATNSLDTIRPEEASVSATAVLLLCLRENVALWGKFNGKGVKKSGKGS
jgi:hypothetical protein